MDIHIIKKLLLKNSLIILFQIVFLLILNQGYTQNLVPNGDFENAYNPNDTCTNLNIVRDWQRILGSPDWFTTCPQPGNQTGVPSNLAGSQYPFSGIRYFGFCTFSIYHNVLDHMSNITEIPMVRLVERLKKDHKYNFEFYLSLSDSSWYATNNLGIFFQTQQQISEMISEGGNNGFTFDGFYPYFHPQWNYNGDIISNKEGWTRVTGSYIAEGDEEYLSIGNFGGDFGGNSGLDTVLVTPLNMDYDSTVQEYKWRLSYYYLDKVSLIEDTTYKPNNFQEIEALKGNIFFNSQLESVYVRLENNQELLEILIFNSQGEIVAQSKKSIMEVTSLTEGVYSVLVKTSKGVFWKKVVLIR